MAEVEIRNVVKQYAAGIKAVKDVSLTIKDREFMVLVGPSGCGKSTLLRMVAGLEEITSGEICVDGKVVNQLPPKDRSVAMVFQDYALYPHMTVTDNLSFGLRLRKFPSDEIEKRVQEAADILEIRHLLDRFPKQLSGGQRQRVAVGRAIVQRPKVFLFDEPLSNLDAKLRVQMRVELARLHNRLQSTMIYVTHDQTEAMTLGSRITVLRDGNIQQVDTPIRLYQEPANQFVAGFIGMPPMNFVKLSVLHENGVVRLHGGTFDLPVPDEIASMLIQRKQIGRDVVMGVRPEDMYDTLYMPQRTLSAAIRCVVDVVEPLGSEVYVYLRNGPFTLTASMGPETKIEPQQEMNIVLDFRKVKFFDPETEKRIDLHPAA